MVLLQDRAERAARFAKSKEEAEAAKAAALQAKQAEIEARKEASQKERRWVAVEKEMYFFVERGKETSHKLLRDLIYIIIY